MRVPKVQDSTVAQDPGLREGRAGYLGSILRNRREDPLARPVHRPHLRQAYPDAVADDRAADLVVFLRAHDGPRHWKNNEHKPCWCRECWWARWELDAAGKLPPELVVEREQARSAWS